MEIKVGQWIRLTNGSIYKSNNNLIDNNKNKYVAIANTPQELIEVGDLVVDTEYKNPFTVDGFTKTKDGKCLLNDIDGWIIPLKDVTKILTPHGKDYICQWEEEE